MLPRSEGRGGGGWYVRRDEVRSGGWYACREEPRTGCRVREETLRPAGW